MNHDLVTLLLFVLLAAVMFVPVLMLELLPFVRRAKNKRWLTWLLGILSYIASCLLLAAWTGEILESSQGDLSITAFWVYMIVYLVSPFFYAVFFRDGKRSKVFAIVIASLMALAAAGMILVPILYGVNPQLGLSGKLLGVAGICLPQLINAAFYIHLSRRAHSFLQAEEL